jgi:hypothetical protein
MEAILVADGDERLKDIVKYNEFLEQEKKLEKERQERDRKRRLEIARRNKEKNEHLQSPQKPSKLENIAEIHSTTSDPDKAT